VAGESASGLTRVALDTGLPVVNGILTTDDEEQARVRVNDKGRDAARVAVEMGNLIWALAEDGEQAPGAS
jgi:6,7-dimethyl-8-ribityllumazine synthase